MPPKGERLSAAEIATLTAWINEGAVWPDGVDRGEARGQARPLELQAARGSRAAGVEGQAAPSIDRFILAKLERERPHARRPKRIA